MTWEDEYYAELVKALQRIAKDSGYGKIITYVSDGLPTAVETVVHQTLGDKRSKSLIGGEQHVS